MDQSGFRVQAHLECLRVWGEFVNAWHSPSDSPDLHCVVGTTGCSRVTVKPQLATMQLSTVRLTAIEI